MRQASASQAGTAGAASVTPPSDNPDAIDHLAIAIAELAGFDENTPFGRLDYARTAAAIAIAERLERIARVLEGIHHDYLAVGES